MDFSRVYENLKSAIFNKSDTTIISSIVDKPILYGTLIVLGTTKEGKLKKFQLRRRPKGNGVVVRNFFENFLKSIENSTINLEAR